MKILKFNSLLSYVVKPTPIFKFYSNKKIIIGHEYFEKKITFNHISFSRTLVTCL